MQLPAQNLEPFNVEVTEVPLGVIVRIKGFLGMCDQSELHSQLTAVGQQCPRFVVLDLANVEFISSLAFCALILFRKGIIRDGGTVRIAAMQPLVEEAFTILRLHWLFDVCGTVEEAFAF